MKIIDKIHHEASFRTARGIVDNEYHLDGGDARSLAWDMQKSSLYWSMMSHKAIMEALEKGNVQISGLNIQIKQ